MLVACTVLIMMGFSVLVPLACVAWWTKKQDAREAKRLADATAAKMAGGAA